VKKYTKRQLLLTTLLSGAVIGTSALPAFAQDQDQDDQIVVTGTRIKQKNLVSSSPVTTVSEEDIASRGVVRIEDMVNQMPQVFAGQAATIANGSSGTATVDLRGLGPSRTMVLIDGRRMGPGSPNTIAPDLNQIPAALVKNVHILTGGAGAVYGSDALAGVVNFEMDRDFEGFRVDAMIGAYQHNNNNKDIQALLASSGNLTPSMSANQLDGAIKDFTIIYGADINGRGNVTAFLGYRNVKELTQANRDYSGCAFGSGTNPGGDVTCSGSFTTPHGTFTDATFSQFFYTLDEATGNTFRNLDFANDRFNYNPTNHFQRPDQRFTAGIFAHYDITDKDEVYSDFMYMDDRSIAQIAFSGNFFVTSQVSCDNPFLSAQQRNLICTSRGFGPTDIADLTFGRRNVEGDPRQADLRHTSYRFVGGIRGDFRLLKGFEYDISTIVSKVHYAENYKNEISISRAQNALLATTDANGNPICRPDLVSDPTCVPINWFQIGGVTREALDYVQGQGFQDGNVEQTSVIATISGDLGQYGFKMPGATDGAQIVVGAEYREDDYERRVDRAFETGDLAGQGGPTNGLAGRYDSREVFGELQFPLLQDAPFAEELTFKGAYRYADNELSGGSDSYSAALIWQPNSLVRLRGQYQRAVRAANAIELFRASSIGLFNMTIDPCANGSGPGGVGIAATAAQCANSGVTAAQYGNITANPAGQYNALFGGNTALNPETSDTYTIGGVFHMPGSLDGMTVSVDYFDITVNGFIGTVPPTDAVNRCVFDGDPFFCSLVNRDPASGSLWINQNGFVTATNVNTGSLATRGVDVNANYDFDLPSNLGGMDLRVTGTYLIDFQQESLPGDTPFECVGIYGDRCGTPNPEWRHIAKATWRTPLDLDAQVTWRYFSNVKADPGVGAAADSFDAELGAANFFDLALTYRGIDNVTLRAGVNNIFDAEPPLSSSVGAGAGNGNTFPSVYDALGRFLFARATIDF